MEPNRGPMFWNVEGTGAGGNQQDFQINDLYQLSGNLESEDSFVSYIPKRVKLSPDPNHQDGDGDSSGQSSPLGLTLRKTPSFVNLLETTLHQSRRQRQNNLSTETSNHQNNLSTETSNRQSNLSIVTSIRQSNLSTETNSRQAHNRSRRRTDDFRSQPISEKLKASNFPALTIRIGTWERVARHEGELIAKLYYAKRKLVWEILHGSLKSKIEIQWSEIVAIRAVLDDEVEGVFEIELDQPPLFYKETNPQPRKHTLWTQTHDFTGGQAPLYRRHRVTFSPGVLNKHYEKLLLCDARLLALSLRGFPSKPSPYFDASVFSPRELFFSMNGYGSRLPPAMQYPYATYPATAADPVVLMRNSSNFQNLQGPPLHGLMASSSTTRGNIPLEGSTFWDVGVANNVNIPGGSNAVESSSLASMAQPNQFLVGGQNCHSWTYLEDRGRCDGVLNQIANHLLRDQTQGFVSPDAGSLLSRVNSMGNLINHPVNMNFNNTSELTRVDCNYQVNNSQVMHQGSIDPFCGVPSLEHMSLQDNHESPDASMSMGPTGNNSFYLYALPDSANANFSTLGADPNIQNWT